MLVVLCGGLTSSLTAKSELAIEDVEIPESDQALKSFLDDDTGNERETSNTTQTTVPDSESEVERNPLVASEEIPVSSPEVKATAVETKNDDDVNTVENSSNELSVESQPEPTTDTPQ